MERWRDGEKESRRVGEKERWRGGDRLCCQHRLKYLNVVVAKWYAASLVIM